MRRGLADALARLEREVAAPAAPAPVTVTKTPVRDADHRVLHVDVASSDGRRWRKTPTYDADHRITRVTVEQLPPEPAP